MKRTKGVCPLWATFFGLTSDYITSVYEMFFNMKQHGNWNFFELYALPIKLRNWFAERLIKHHKDMEETAAKNQSHS